MPRDYLQEVRDEANRAAAPELEPEPVLSDEAVARLVSTFNVVRSKAQVFIAVGYRKSELCLQHDSAGQLSEVTVRKHVRRTTLALRRRWRRWFPYTAPLEEHLAEP